MQYFQRDNCVEIINAGEFDPVKTFECGQCFRWNADKNGVYLGVAMKRAAKVWKTGESVFISGTLEDFENIWRDYFDLDRDYGALRKSLNTDEYIKKAADYGAGIRILRQDKWEVLCSFIISQCNNIPRIKKIIESLCERFGEPLYFEDKTLYAFPDAAKIAGLTEKELEPIKSGYRAKYIIEAANAVASGAIDLDMLASGSCDQALRVLKGIEGVGDKVAGCVILFGLNILDAFPVDVWIKRAITANYGEGFNPKIFGKAAGLAQQYMFYYARSNSTA